MENFYVEASFLVHVVDCVQFFDYFSLLFVMQFSSVSKVILEDFFMEERHSVHMKKSKYSSMFL